MMMSLHLRAARFQATLSRQPVGKTSILFHSEFAPYGTITVNSPGSTNVITPPHMHASGSRPQ